MEAIQLLRAARDVGCCERRDEREAIVEIPVKWEELELRLVTNQEAH